jgi:hypothetical protein
MTSGDRSRSGVGVRSRADHRSVTKQRRGRRGDNNRSGFGAWVIRAVCKRGIAARFLRRKVVRLLNSARRRLALFCEPIDGLSIRSSNTRSEAGPTTSSNGAPGADHRYAMAWVLLERGIRVPIRVGIRVALEVPVRVPADVPQNSRVEGCRGGREFPSGIRWEAVTVRGLGSASARPGTLRPVRVRPIPSPGGNTIRPENHVRRQGRFASLRERLRRPLTPDRAGWSRRPRVGRSARRAAPPPGEGAAARSSPGGVTTEPIRAPRRQRQEQPGAAHLALRRSC